MAIRNRYSSLDMVRMAKFAKENPELKPIPLIKAYNEKYPEITKEQKLKNIRNWLGIELCDSIDDLNEKAALTLHDVNNRKSKCRHLNVTNRICNRCKALITYVPDDC